MAGFKDFSIDMPWGLICGRSWGNECATPVLMLHGIQDNAGSFDLLVPQLPQGFYYFCLDLPGHGKSSPLSEGFPLEMIQYVVAIKKVVSFKQWNKLYLIGHSLGAQLTMLFTSLYPDIVIKAVMIDGLTPLFVPTEASVKHTRRRIQELEDLERTLNTKTPPSYSYQEALVRIMNNRRSSLGETAARKLLERCLIETESGFRFSTDQRLKLLIRPLMTLGQIETFISNMKVPVLLILADETFKDYEKVLGEGFYERLRALFTGLPYFDYKLVKGNHNVHMDHPQRVAPLITDFITQVKSSL